MSFDQPTRNALAKMVGDCRRLLTEDVRKQLQGTYGLQPDGSALPIDALGHLDERNREIARELREWQAPLAVNEGGTEAKQSAAAFNGSGYRRRLFADDAARGFAFVDVCGRWYDVVLMNPPFGEFAKAAKGDITARFPRTKNDVYAAFVERGVHSLYEGGMLGAITSRTGFFLSSFQRWREEILLQEAPPVVFADLGYGVLDAAMVEVAATCLQKSTLSKSAGGQVSGVFPSEAIAVSP
jgi:hypothetical protein